MPQAIDTTTKADTGHDVPIDCVDAAELIGVELFDQVQSLSLKLYAMGSRSAQAANLILADTKFEFGIDHEEQLYLIDEVLTPIPHVIGLYKDMLLVVRSHLMISNMFVTI